MVVKVGREGGDLEGVEGMDGEYGKREFGR